MSLLPKELLASQGLCCMDADAMKTGGWIEHGIKKVQNKEQNEHQGDNVKKTFKLVRTLGYPILICF